MDMRDLVDLLSNPEHKKEDNSSNDDEDDEKKVQDY